MKLPKISIILPYVTQNADLERTLDSISVQNYPSLELLPVKRGSSDKNFSEAINQGLKKASGEIIGWISPANRYAPYALYKVANAFSNQHVNIVFGQEASRFYVDNPAKTIVWPKTNHSEIFVRNSIAYEVGLWDTNLSYTAHKDWWMRYMFLYGLEGVSKTHDLLIHLENNQYFDNNVYARNFQIEQDSFYYVLANASRLYDYVYLLKNNCILIPNFKINTFKKYSADLVVQVLNYYTFKRSREFYLQQECEKAKEFIQQVNKKLLSKEDQQLYKKINKLLRLPKFIKPTLPKQRPL